MEILIKMEGRELPCAPSMGAMLRFKEITDKEVNQIDAGSLSELCTYLYCCVASACNRAGIAFDMALMDFADRITPEDMAGWRDTVTTAAGDATEEGEKKSPPGS